MEEHGNWQLFIGCPDPVFMTQDAIPEDEYLLEHLLKPYEDPASYYARQLAGNEADLLERFTRNFNYQDK